MKKKCDAIKIIGKTRGKPKVQTRTQKNFKEIQMS